MWIIDGIITQMTIMFYVIACFLKVDAAGRCIIVSKKKKKNFFKKRNFDCFLKTIISRPGTE